MINRDFPAGRERLLSVDMFVNETVVDVESYKNDYAVLVRETNELKATKDALERELRRCQSFFLDPTGCNVDHTRFLYLTTKVNFARHAGFPSKIKSAKNEYLQKVSELRKTLKLTVLKRLEEVAEDTKFIRSLHERTASQTHAFIQDLQESEKSHWKEIVSSTAPVVVTDPDDDFDAMCAELEQRAQLTSDLTRDIVEDAHRHMDRVAAGMPTTATASAGRGPPLPTPLAHSIPQRTVGFGKSSDPLLITTTGEDGDDGDSQSVTFLDRNLAQLRDRSKPLLDSYAEEVRAAMQRCLEMASAAVQKKHSPLQTVAKSNSECSPPYIVCVSCLICHCCVCIAVPLDNVLSRIAELRAVTESFKEHQEVCAAAQLFRGSQLSFAHCVDYTLFRLFERVCSTSTKPQSRRPAL